MSRCLEWRTGNYKVPYVVELPGNGNLVDMGALRQASNDIGEVMTTCISLFSPEIVSVGGRLATASDHLIADIKEVVYQRPPHLPRKARPLFVH